MIGLNFIVLGILLSLVGYTDLRRNVIPNIYVFWGLFLGLSYYLFTQGLGGIVFSLIGAIAGFLLFLILYLFKAVGLGDVKLFAAIGALTGLEFVLYSSLYSILYAGLLGLFLLGLKKGLPRNPKGAIGRLSKAVVGKVLIEGHKENSYHFPFMLAVIPGVITTYYFFL